MRTFVVGDAPVRRLTILRESWLPSRTANGIQVVRTAEAFAQLGIGVSLYFVPSRTLREDVRTYYDIQSPLRLMPLPRAVLPLRKAFRTERWTSMPALGHAILWSGFVTRLAAKSGADLYLVREPIVAWWLGCLGARTVLELHDVPPGVERGFLRLAAALGSVRAIVTTTEGLRNECVERLHIPGDRVVTVGNGVDLDRAVDLVSKGRARAELGLSTDVPVVAYTGHLYPWKGVDTLVQALARLPGIHGVIAGGMPEDVARLRGLVTELGVDNVTVTGHLAPDRVPLVLRAADVAVLPNSARCVHSAHYTSPMKLFEYMAAGLPIVASDLPSIREVLEDGRNAILVPPDDAGALARGVERVLRAPELAKRIASAGYRYAQEHTWKKRARRILDVATEVGAGR